MKIVTIVGARPQLIKAAAVSREIRKHSDIQEVILHTGQHFDEMMSAVFFEEMEISAPNYNLNIDSLSHGAMTGRMIEEIEKVLVKERSDYVLVYGDTNSTLAGSLAAKKLHQKVIHVEAGLRSFNMKMPEEINRILTDRISDMLFCPTELAIENLKKEGFDHIDCKITKCGDVMYDNVLHFSPISDEKAMIIKDLDASKFVLCTVHRQENTDNIDNLYSILDGLNAISEKLPVILPVHPRTKKMIEKHQLDSSVKMIEPVGYLDMVALLKNCAAVVTDSGGLQKEAYFFKKRCITIREETEWVELVDVGWNVVVGSNTERIIEEAMSILKDQAIPSQWEPLYGDGNAAEIIVNTIIEDCQ